MLGWEGRVVAVRVWKTEAGREKDGPGRKRRTGPEGQAGRTRRGEMGRTGQGDKDGEGWETVDSEQELMLECK